LGAPSRLFAGSPRSGRRAVRRPVPARIHRLGHKAKECRAEWAKWQKAAGTGKVVGVGSCHDAGPFLTVKIRKPGEKVEKPDAVYTPDVLERFGGLYMDGDWVRESPIRDLLAFAKERERARKEAERQPR